MPNHCDQQVNISGPWTMVQELYFNLSRGHNARFCDAVTPMPLDKVDDAYNWRWDNWGTKWDVCDVYLRSDLTWSEDNSTGDFDFTCWTPWGPPVPVWDKLLGLGIKVHAYYQDEGCMFEGKYIDGNNTSWDPSEIDIDTLDRLRDEDDFVSLLCRSSDNE